MIKIGNHVMTSRGNHGRVMLVGETTAKVRIGNNTYEIELTNLANISDGTLFKVEYLISGNEIHKTNVFVKHATSLYDFDNGGNKLLLVVENLLKKQISEDFKVINVLIP